MKIMSSFEVKDFEERFRRAEQNLSNREAEEERCLLEMERNLKLLGITAVEDLLQEDVKSSINNIREAGIKGEFRNTKLVLLTEILTLCSEHVNFTILENAYKYKLVIFIYLD